MLLEMISRSGFRERPYRLTFQNEIVPGLELENHGNKIRFHFENIKWNEFIFTQ